MDKCDELTKPNEPARPYSKFGRRPDVSKRSDIDELRTPGESERLSPCERYAFVVTTSQDEGWNREAFHYHWIEAASRIPYGSSKSVEIGRCNKKSARYRTRISFVQPARRKCCAKTVSNEQDWPFAFANRFGKPTGPCNINRQLPIVLLNAAHVGKNGLPVGLPVIWPGVTPTAKSQNVKVMEIAHHPFS
jgi:hypothetical protein